MIKAGERDAMMLVLVVEKEAHKPRIVSGLSKLEKAWKWTSSWSPERGAACPYLDFNPMRHGLDF